MEIGNGSQGLQLSVYGCSPSVPISKRSSRSEPEDKTLIATVESEGVSSSWRGTRIIVAISRMLVVFRLCIGSSYPCVRCA